MLSGWTTRARAASQPAAPSQALLDAIPQGLALFDAAQRLLAHNAAFARQLGAPAELLRPGTGFAALVQACRPAAAPGPDALPGLLMMDGEVPAQPRRVERALPGCPQAELLFTALPEGGFALSVTDLSPLRQAQAAARDTRQLLDFVAETAGMQLAYWDRTHHCRYANAAYLQALGRPAAQVLDRHVADVLPPALRQARQPRIAAALGGKAQVFDESFTDADGRSRTLQVHLVPDGPAGSVQGVWLLASDTTELHNSRDAADHAIQARSHFLANMGHELRTPLNAVIGVLQLLQASGLSPRQADYAAKAQRASRALLGVLGDLIDFSAAESGELKLAPRPFALEDLLRELSTVQAAQLGDKDLALRFDIDPAVPAMLVADDARLRQVLLHLGGNAIKFTDAGEVVLRIALAARQDGQVTLDLSVSDTGMGIEPDLLERLLADYGQAEASATRRFGGAGLGLSVSRRLLALMGSELRATSRPGQGSCFSFRVTLPEAPVQQAPADDPAAHIGALRVLVAHADEASRSALANLARSHGWVVHEAADVQQAQDALLHGRHLQALVIDWRFGGEAFAFASRAALELANREVALVVTGPAWAEGRLDALHQGRTRRAVVYLPQPATAGMLAEAMVQALDERREVRRAANPASGGAPLAGLRLLVAEDNRDNQMVTRELLTAQGAQVEIAEDGMDTLGRLVGGGPYDAILMDWQMPNMDGLEATRVIRQIVGYQDIPVIALTANATAADREECLAAGMDDHVGKPVDVRELTSVLLRHLRPGALRAAETAAAPQAQEQAPVQALDLDLASPPATPVLDRTTAIERLGGSRDLYDQLGFMFQTDGPLTVERMAQALRAGERAEAKRHAHTLKGTAATLGADELAGAARQAESAFGGDAGPGDEAAVAQVEQALARTLQALVG